MPTLVLIGLVASVVSSLGAPLIPLMARQLDVSLGAAQWILTATLLAGAVATPVMGRLADGRRLYALLIWSLALVLVGCLIAASTSSYSVLLAARALQGGGLGLFPVVMVVARRHLQVHKVGSAFAILSVTSAVGVGLGYPISGLLAEAFGYRAAFVFGGAVAAIALVCALFLPSSRDVVGNPIDVVAATYLSVALIGVVLVLSEGSAWGWLSPAVVTVAGASLVAVALWVDRELRASHAYIDIRQLGNRLVRTVLLVGLLSAVSMYVFMPSLVEFVQAPADVGYGFDASVVVSSCLLVPFSIGAATGTRLRMAVVGVVGEGLVIPVATTVCAGAMAVFAFDQAGLWEAFVVMFVVGAGMGVGLADIADILSRAVGSAVLGRTLGFYQLLRSIGFALGSAVAGSILTHSTPTGTRFPVVGGYRDALLLASGIGLLGTVTGLTLARTSATSQVAP